MPMSGEGCKTGNVDHLSDHVMAKYVTHIAHAA
jgi:hypothetical protein